MRLHVVIFSVLAIVILCFSPLFSRVALARWYSWFSSDSNTYYGVWATILTPNSAPPTASGDHTSYSVTTPGGNRWIQAGWIHYPGQAAERYYEYQVSGGSVRLIPSGIQYWGTDVKYEVSQDGNPVLERWCVWIGTILKNCWNYVASVPTTMIIQSEDHTNPQETVFYTTFQSIRVRNAAGNWVMPTLQGHLHADPPYGITQLAPDEFRTWRYGIFLPMLTK